MPKYPKALPHDLPIALGENLFAVYGSVYLNPILRITRTMTIVRHDDELTLINPVRMNDDGLRALEALGTVRHVLRLGPLHGMDDPFYVDRYKAEFWSFEGGTTYTEPAISKPLVAGGPLPFPDAELLAFEHVKQPEGAILIRRGRGVLVTCDAVQSYTTPPHQPHTPLWTRLILPLAGFPRKTIIGPVWIKLIATSKEKVREDFERLLALEFDQLIAAHGTFLPRNAHAEFEAAFAQTFNR